MTEEEERKQLGEIIIGLATKISKLEKKLIDLNFWVNEYLDLNAVCKEGKKKLYEILDRK